MSTLVSDNTLRSQIAPSQRNASSDAMQLDPQAPLRRESSVTDAGEELEEDVGEEVGVGLFDTLEEPLRIGIGRVVDVLPARLSDGGIWPAIANVMPRRDSVLRTPFRGSSTVEY